MSKGYTVKIAGMVIERTDSIYRAADLIVNSGGVVLNERGQDVTAAVLRYADSFPEGTK